jgi:hypothetical protein
VVFRDQLCRTDSNREQRAALGLVDPVLQKACGRNIAVLTQRMRRAQEASDPLVVFAKLRQHADRRHKLGIVVRETLQSRRVARRAQRGPAEFAHPLGDGIDRPEDLICLLIQQQVVVAKRRPDMCQWKFLVLKYRATVSASRAFSAAEMSRIASDAKLLGVCSGARRRSLISESAMVSFLG